MADYYPLLSRAVAALDHNTPEQRRVVYERARAALVRQLRSINPPLTEPEITRERLGLEDAVRRVEAEARAQEMPPPVQAQPLKPRGTPVTPSPQPPPAQPAPPPVAAPRTHDVNRAPQPAPFPEQPVPSYPQQHAHPASRRENPQRHSRRGSSRNSVPMRVRVAPLAAVSVVALLIAGGVGMYLVRDTIASWFNGTEVELQSEQLPVIKNEGRVISDGDTGDTENSVAAVSPSAPIVEPPPLGASPAVTQRAMLYEESPNNENGIAAPASVVWRTEKIPSNVVGQPQETQLRADISIPERKMQIVMLMKRNTDSTLPASHTLEIQFVLPPGFDNGGVANVPGLLFKESEDARGTVLDGLSVRVTNDFFLIGLANTADKQKQNLELLSSRPWIDLPIQYENGRRAVLTIEKGVPGEKAFKDAVEAWNISAQQAQSAQ